MNVKFCKLKNKIMFNESKMSHIDEKYSKKLKELLDDIEKETRSKFKITIEEWGNGKQCIGDFELRQDKVLVYDMDKEYKELEGEYKSVKDVENKIKMLLSGYTSLSDFFDESNITDGSKWRDFGVSYNSGMIYTCAGGSFSVCHPKGKYKFI